MFAAIDYVYDKMISELTIIKFILLMYTNLVYIQYITFWR